MRKWRALSVVLMVCGCVNAQTGDTPANGQSADVNAGLGTSLEVQVEPDTVRFVLHLTNAGTQPRVLEFNSAARYDFEVRTPAGEPVWQWSAGQMFAQMLGTETLPAGGSRSYSAAWAPGGRTGPHVAVGRVLATNHEIEQRTNFELPTR